MQPTEIRKLSLTSQRPPDKIIATRTGTFNSPAPTGTPNPAITTSSINIPIADTCFFQGIFSVDGGVTWQDFNANIPTTRAGNIVLQTVTVVAESLNDGTMNIKCLNYYDYTNSVGTAYTVLWELLAIAKPNQAPLNFQPIGSKMFFDSTKDYQKIDTDTYQTLSVIGSISGNVIATATFPHAPGYRPKFRVYIDQSTDTLNLNPNGLYDIQTQYTGRVLYSATVDENNVYVSALLSFSPATYSARVYVRTYYDS